MSGSVYVASHAGFCFGVRRATDAIEEKLRQAHGHIYTLGRLIHNDGYVNYLKSRGVEEICGDDIDRICADAERGENITVVIRAHGEVRENLEKFERCAASHPNLEILDCTCPYVNKVRRIAADNSGEGKLFILIGAAEHPEVRGIMSCTNGVGMVFPNSHELSQWIATDEGQKSTHLTISAAAQTTQKLSEWKKCLEIIEKVYTNPKIFDTICNVTGERQREASKLAEDSDVVLVIGSRDSSNTAKLFEICRERCPRTYFLENAGAAFDVKMTPNDRISITAGASTPYSVIQEVEKAMNEQMTENFAEMLENSIKTLNTGDVVKGIVTSIGTNEIHLDLGAKTTGVITHDQICDDPSAKLSDMFKIGDEIEAFVIKVSDVDGIATLSKKRVDSDKNWNGIVAAYENGDILEGKVVEAVKGGVIISVNSVRIFIPGAHTGIPRDGDLSTLVGTTQKIKVIEIKSDRKKAYGSIRVVARDERRKKEEAFWNTVEEGMEFDGEVRSLTSYGAFVDLGGVDGMVHSSELSWRHIKHPSEVVKVGDVIHVFVKAIDRDRKRISLGYKTEDMNPWNIFTKKYSVGDTAEVKVVSLMPFGAFAEIVPGVDGLIHISQITDHKIGKPDDVLSAGQIVSAKITDVDEENHKVSLSIRALMEEAAAPAEEEYEEEEDSAPAVYSTDDPSSYADFAGDEE